MSWESFQNLHYSRMTVGHTKMENHIGLKAQIEIQKVTLRSLFLLYVHLMITKKRKSTYKNFVSACFSLWTSQGLNLGPPDYESVALTN